MVEVEVEVEAIVAKTRERLARIAGREALRRRAWRIVAIAAAAGALRWLWLPRPERLPAWAGAPLAAGAMLVIGVALTIGVARHARRAKRPSDLGAARRLDAALGLCDVVASGLELRRDRAAGEMAELARRRAAEAVTGVKLEALFALPRLLPSRRGAGLGGAIALVAVLAGSYDPLLASVIASPPSDGEVAAATALEQAAIKLEANKASKDAPKPRGSDERARASQHARAAAKAAAHGDRQKALRELGALRESAERDGRRGKAIDAALRQLASALDVARPASRKKAARAAKASESVAEHLSLLAKSLRSEAAPSDPESRARMLERLTRGAEKAGERGHAELAKALRQAAAALSQNEREAAARALDEAAARAEELEAERREAEAEADAIIEMLESAGELERSVQLALLDAEGKLPGSCKGGKDKDGKSDQCAGDGDGNGEHARSIRLALARRLAALGFAPRAGNGPDGSGAHVADRGASPRKGMKVKRDEHAPSQVGEGGRAVAAIQGLGSNGAPNEPYRDVYPSYGAVAEEALADESIPAARRAVVRRYFEAIRPGPGADSENEEKKP